MIIVSKKRKTKRIFLFTTLFAVVFFVVVIGIVLFCRIQDPFVSYIPRDSIIYAKVTFPLFPSRERKETLNRIPNLLFPFGGVIDSTEQERLLEVLSYSGGKVAFSLIQDQNGDYEYALLMKPFRKKKLISILNSQERDYLVIDDLVIFNNNKEFWQNLFSDQNFKPLSITNSTRPISLFKTKIDGIIQPNSLKVQEKLIEGPFSPQFLVYLTQGENQEFKGTLYQKNWKLTFLSSKEPESIIPNQTYFPISDAEYFISLDHSYDKLKKYISYLKEDFPNYGYYFESSLENTLFSLFKDLNLEKRSSFINSPISFLGIKEDNKTINSIIIGKNSLGQLDVEQIEHLLKIAFAFKSPQVQEDTLIDLTRIQLLTADPDQFIFVNYEFQGISMQRLSTKGGDFLDLYYMYQDSKIYVSQSESLLIQLSSVNQVENLDDIDQCENKTLFYVKDPLVFRSNDIHYLEVGQGENKTSLCITFN